jgi:hypothetical protein
LGEFVGEKVGEKVGTCGRKGGKLFFPLSYWKAPVCSPQNDDKFGTWSWNGLNLASKWSKFSFIFKFWSLFLNFGEISSKFYFYLKFHPINYIWDGIQQ